MCLLGSTNVFILGRRNNKHTVARYNTETGGEVSSVQLPSSPAGMTKVDLDTIPCVALSYP